MLNQWNPLALLSLANRSTNCYAASTSTQQRNSHESSSSQWTDDAGNGGLSVPAASSDCRATDSSSLSSSSPPPDRCQDATVDPPFRTPPQPSVADHSSEVDPPFRSLPHSTSDTIADVQQRSSSSFSPTELLSLVVDRDPADGGLLSVVDKDVAGGVDKDAAGVGLLSVVDRDPACGGGWSDDDSESELLHVEQQSSSSSLTISLTDEARKRMSTRLKKRTSVDILPSFTCSGGQRRTSTPKISKTASVGDSSSAGVEIPPTFSSGSPAKGESVWPMVVLPPGGELRVSSSDPHLSGLAKLHSSAGGRDPMISMIDHDINSPSPMMMFMNDSGVEIPPAGFPLLESSQPSTYILPCETMAVDIGKSSHSVGVSEMNKTMFT